MILQALTEYYRTLERQGIIAAPGWGPVRVSYALHIGAGGELKQALSVQTEQERGKKVVLAPQTMILPAPVKRTVGVAANFLWDNSSYILGIDDKNKPGRTRQCFEACKALHEQVLKGVDSAAARAVLAFFRTWEPKHARENPVLAGDLKGILSGSNLVFWTEEGYAHNDPAVRRAWEAHYNAVEDGPQGICLVTGEWGPVESVHPSIKNVAGAQSVGAALVSFNKPAFCSYDKKQSLNAPIGKYAAFAYTAALNHLLADRAHVCHIGDTTVVCWARGGGDLYQTLFNWAALGNSEIPYDESELRNMVKQLCRGAAVEFQAQRLDPEMDFYVLGLSPNAARLSVRFFLRNSFGSFLRNMQAHQARLKIIRPTADKFEELPLWKLLGETVNAKAREKAPSPDMAGKVLRAILCDTPYPATLLNGVTLRIRAEREITRARAAILKAYYLKNPHSDVPKEVLAVALNEESSNIPYTLGRIFSVLETIQSLANPRIKTTIRDKYFNSAAAMPAVIFPYLIRLAQIHLKKMLRDKTKLAKFYDKQLAQLLNNIDQCFPTCLNLPQQGSFQLGYYYQTQARYQSKEEN